MSLRESAQQALDEMIEVHSYWYERNRLGDEGTSNVYDEDMPTHIGLLNAIGFLRAALAEPERKPLNEDQMYEACINVWRNLPDGFGHTSSEWIEAGIRYAERAHGIGEQK
jgi:hypothetical protein